MGFYPEADVCSHVNSSETPALFCVLASFFYVDPRPRNSLVLLLFSFCMIKSNKIQWILDGL